MHIYMCLCVCVCVCDVVVVVVTFRSTGAWGEGGGMVLAIVADYSEICKNRGEIDFRGRL